MTQNLRFSLYNLLSYNEPSHAEIKFNFVRCLLLFRCIFLRNAVNKDAKPYVEKVFIFKKKPFLTFGFSKLQFFNIVCNILILKLICV